MKNPQQPVLWFWGHEHRLAFYGLRANQGPLRAYGRCVGNGGFPDYLHGIPDDAEQACLKVYDNRRYETVEKANLGFNGYVNLTFTANVLTVEYRSTALAKGYNKIPPEKRSRYWPLDPEKDVLLAHEKWSVDPQHGVLQGPEFHLDDEALTQVSKLSEPCPGN